MHYISGSILSTAFSAVIVAGQAMLPPQDTYRIEQPTAVVQPMREAFNNTHLQECMLERRRMLYEARTNTLILSNIVSASHQEVATGLKL